MLFNSCTVEALCMRWLKRDIWKVGIALAGMLLLVLMVWVKVEATGAYEGTSGLATPGTITVTATPTEDATVAALNKEKLAQEVQQLQQNNDRGLGDWLWSNAAAVLSSFLSTLVVVIGVLIGFRQWSVGRRDTQRKEADDRIAAQDKELEDRKAERERRDEEQKRWLKDQEAERERRAEERFQVVVEGLGSEREEAQIGAAITLRTFLRPGYEQFYTQVFDLAVAHLRLPRTPNPAEDPNTPLPLTTLRQALIVVFKEAFPLARSLNKGNPQSPLQFLDATGIQLDNAFLWRADLNQTWMREASLRGATLWKATLKGANFRGADLRGTDLKGTDLRRADFRETDLRGADLKGTDLRRANLRGADLSWANLSEARLHEANLSWANLSWANLSEANLEYAQSLKDTDLRYVKGLTKEQLEACKAKGAIIDEDTTTSPPQPSVSPSPPSQSTNMQAPSAPPVQESTPTPGVDGSSATPSSKPSNGIQVPSVLPAQVSTLTPDTSGSGAASSKLGPES
jgi:uncharacterized protein YjbI with pentapeptide repeats